MDINTYVINPTCKSTKNIPNKAQILETHDSLEVEQIDEVEEIMEPSLTLFSMENLMFLSMFLISIVVVIYLTKFELKRKKNASNLSSICDIGYCYYLNVDLLISASKDGLNNFEAVHNKLDYLESIGVQLLIVNKINLHSNNPDYIRNMRKTLIDARNRGITIYMMVEELPVNVMIVEYINFGILGFVSSVFSDLNGSIDDASNLTYLKNILLLSRVPVNGLLLYLPTTKTLNDQLIISNNFNYTIVPITKQLSSTINYDKVIFSPKNKHMKVVSKPAINDRLNVMAKILVQQKCLIYAGYEFDGNNMVELFTKNEPIIDSKIIILMKQMNKFRKENIMFQKSKRCTINPVDNSAFVVYKRCYIDEKDPSKSAQFYSFIKEKRGLQFFEFEANTNQIPKTKLTWLLVHPNGLDEEQFVNKTITLGQHIPISDSLILMIIQAQ